MKCDCGIHHADKGPDPYVFNVEQMALENRNFRTAIWTGCNLQMTLMSIPPCGEIGAEIHENTDQFIRVEQGRALVKMGKCAEHQSFCKHISKGEVVFVPAGTWHNVMNIGRIPLKVSSVYAPLNHPRGTVHRTKAETEES